MGRETSAALKELFERIETWPEEAQAEAVRMLEEIEVGFDAALSDEDIAAIEAGVEDERQGRLVSMTEIKALFDQYRDK